MRNEYRLIPAEVSMFSPYELQCRRWWFPVWMWVDFAISLEEGRERAVTHAGTGRKDGVSVYLGRLP